MDDGACLYNKLTHEPKGSGDLMRQDKCIIIILHIFASLHVMGMMVVSPYIRVQYVSA